MEKLCWADRQDFLGRERGVGERLVAEKLVRRLFIFSPDTMESREEANFRVRPNRFQAYPQLSVAIRLWENYVSKLCELPGVDKVEMRERCQMSCVIQTALGCGPEIQVLIAYSRRSEIPCT